MYKPPILPRITRVELSGYRPLFSKTVKFDVKNNRFLILGGNGLGKTTILQSIVYCLAGEVDGDIEIEKSKRWGKKYFTGRLANPNAATVETEFFLANDKITLKRGFESNRLLSFRVNDRLESRKTAEEEFEAYLKDVVGYRTLNDFRFLVHKLCYLPEDRTNLVWDADAQVRLLMLLFNDIIDATEFRDKREKLRQFDSKRRHINVAINKARKQLQSLYEFDEYLVTENGGNDVDQTPSSQDNGSSEQLQTKLLKQINDLAQERIPLQKQIKSIEKEITRVASEIESIRDKLAQHEENFILNQLDRFESEEVKLAIHKLLHRSLCPFCSSFAEELSQQAQNYKNTGCCPLCGTKIEQEELELSGMPALDAELSEKIRRRVSLENELIDMIRQLEEVSSKEEELQSEYDEFRLSRPIVSPNYEIQQAEKRDLDGELQKLELDYQETGRRFEQLRVETEREYQIYNLITSERMERLGKLYEQYATAFLGTSCLLEKDAAQVKFLELDLYVPSFNNEVRSSPDTCSEAQRFFLDIAFRMAMIDLAKELSNAEGSFICETPENALDLAYVDNVATMFKRFSKGRHSLIATGNLQAGALAKPMLSDYSTEQRRESILNLLDYGILSKVQEDKRHELERELTSILGIGV